MAIVRLGEDPDVYIWVGVRVVCGVHYSLRDVHPPQSFETLKDAHHWVLKAKEVGLRVPQGVLDYFSALKNKESDNEN